jgi:hypothetical protein
MSNTGQIMLFKSLQTERCYDMFAKQIKLNQNLFFTHTQFLIACFYKILFKMADKTCQSNNLVQN